MDGGIGAEEAEGISAAVHWSNVLTEADDLVAGSKREPNRIRLPVSIWGNGAIRRELL